MSLVEYPVITFLTKRIRLNFFKAFRSVISFKLIMGYLNPILNNLAQ